MRDTPDGPIVNQITGGKASVDSTLEAPTCPGVTVREEGAWKPGPAAREGPSDPGYQGRSGDENRTQTTQTCVTGEPRDGVG